MKGCIGVARASRCALRALLSMRNVFDDIKKIPQPEEAAEGPSHTVHQYRVKWKKIGAAKTTESRRSSMPPWPSIIWPQSLTPRSRLIADITRPPQNPIRLITSAMIAACHGENGVIHQSAAPSKVALAIPPTRPSTVFDGDRLGAIWRWPSSLPQTYCSTSLDCTTRIKKAISSSERSAKPGIGNVVNAGTCDTQ